MINEVEAVGIASALLGRPGDDPDRPWHLMEFEQGWLINETGYLAGKVAGSLGRVIEKESGRVVRFPSAVPTRRILSDYEAVVNRGRAETV
ncbi:hypothetical protein [Frankia sp. AgKG'84/4]|uniref:hypothetical protein n=1 Tax=Frankia sp. AgKG'84/4 TaxID=573490 RepID=UPI00200DC566|nr:hypothetical protein [Frankia sp. AgKG'84/4]MCL9794387.1 hypothetical protein [Frankia sp. AgKG'84/4]